MTPDYADLLKRPEWYTRRKVIFERDGFLCKKCSASGYDQLVGNWILRGWGREGVRGRGGRAPAYRGWAHVNFRTAQTADTAVRPPSLWFSLEGAARLPQTGNVLVVYGSGVRLSDRLPWSRVREFKHTTPAQVVYDVVFADGRPQPEVTWIAFGGDRIAALNVQ